MMISNNPALSRFLDSYGIIVIVIVMMAILYATQPATFLSAANLSNILKQNAFLHHGQRGGIGVHYLPDASPDLRLGIFADLGHARCI